MTFHLKDLAGLVMDEDDSKPQAQVVTVPPTVKTNVGVTDDKLSPKASRPLISEA